MNWSKLYKITCTIATVGIVYWAVFLRSEPCMAQTEGKPFASRHAYEGARDYFQSNGYDAFILVSNHLDAMYASGDREVNASGVVLRDLIQVAADLMNVGDDGDNVIEAKRYAESMRQHGKSIGLADATADAAAQAVIDDFELDVIDTP